MYRLEVVYFRITLAFRPWDRTVSEAKRHHVLQAVDQQKALRSYRKTAVHDIGHSNIGSASQTYAYEAEADVNDCPMKLLLAGKANHQQSSKCNDSRED